LIADVRAVVVDIEGTTTDIAFVHRTLFPYARARLASFVAEHPGLAEMAAVKASEGVADDAAAVATLERWSDADRKAAPLKSLQGKIWRGGYESGVLKAPVYDDVPGALARWSAAGKRLAVYSSGSVEAQKLLFAHTTAGDLSALFSAWFDTGVGAKSEAASYAALASELGETPGAVLFLSDAPAEVAAARAAGLKAVRVVRDGAPEKGAIASFDELEI
jgi:enolase-phosphatase E1